MGHVRDLPASAAEIPGSYKDQPWARLGIDDHFEPIYIVPAKKKKVVSELRSGPQGRRRTLHRHGRRPRG